MYEVEMSGVTFAFPEMAMNFDLSVNKGSLSIITGPSGSGKSTLLNLIAGFETPASGKIILTGEDLTHTPPSTRPVAMLFQDHNLFDHLSVWANIGLGIRPRLKLTKGENERVRDALARVGLADKGGRLPSELSGGERQRAGFARVLVQNRAILLLDEPFASLGPSLRQEMTALLAQLHLQSPMTILAVTHHPEEWMDVADHFIFVDRGKVASTGPMHEFAGTLASPAIRAYLGNVRP